jgi:hypothetical protein
MKIVVGRDKLDEVQVGVSAIGLAMKGRRKEIADHRCLFYFSRASATSLRLLNSS